MKKQSFLFGLGVGITIVSLIFFFAYTNKRDSYQEQISKLNAEISGLKNSPAPQPTASPTPTPTVAPTNTPSVSQTPEPTASQTTEPVASPVPSETEETKQEATPEPEPVNVKIFIERGTSAKAVCQLLEREGVITSAAELQRFIRENNSSSKIVSGSHTFIVGASFEDILNELKR